MNDVSFALVKKTLPDGNNGWKEHNFYRTAITTRKSADDLEDWCRQRFGSPKYLGDYWVIFSHIILSEKAYMLWKLST